MIALIDLFFIGMKLIWNDNTMFMTIKSLNLIRNGFIVNQNDKNINLTNKLCDSIISLRDRQNGLYKNQNDNKMNGGGV